MLQPLFDFVARLLSFQSDYVKFLNFFSNLIKWASSEPGAELWRTEADVFSIFVFSVFYKRNALEWIVVRW